MFTDTPQTQINLCFLCLQNSFLLFIFLKYTNIPAYTRGGISIAAVGDFLLTRDEILRKLHQHLFHSQHRMKHFIDKERQEKHFQVGDLVLVKLEPYRQFTVAHRLNAKLCKRFFGQFPIIAKVR